MVTAWCGSMLMIIHLPLAFIHHISTCSHVHVPRHQTCLACRASNQLLQTVVDPSSQLLQHVEQSAIAFNSNLGIIILIYELTAVD